ncbi:MAG: helix-turn-helix domain-containing protein [Roseiarcus sp.]
MSGNVLPIIATILEKTALGAHDSEIAELIEMVRDASPSASIGHDIERLHLHLNAVAQVIRESRVTERGLNLLNETTHDLASTLSLQDLLRTIVSRARSLVGANVAYLTRLNDDHTVMRTVATEGMISPATWELIANVGVGAVSLVVSSKSFFDTQDYLGDQRFRHTDSFDRAFKAESIVSLAGFPILSEDKLHGILFIADRYHRKLSGREISVLGSFALHAGVAMRNAHAFTMLSEALAEAERNRVSLIDHIHRVDVSAAAHDEMTSLLAKGTEWPLFIQGMADQIDGAILLYDEAFSVRERFASAAYRGQLAADLKDGKIDSSVLISAVSKSRHSGQSVVMLDVGNEHCRAMALHGGAGRGESLVICHLGELDPIDIRNLERGTVALSIAKLWSEKRETEQLIASSTLLRHLILVNPPDASTISAMRDRLKINTDQPVMLALIAMSGLDRALQTTMIREAAAKMTLLVDLVNDTYLAVGPEKSVRALLQTLLRRRKGWEIGGIVSEPFSDLTQAAVRYAQIEQALRVLRKMNRLNRFVEHSQVNLFAKLFELGDTARIEKYIEQILSPIEERDPRQKTQLKKTLLCYIDSQHNIVRTAELLGVHVNTVRQRLDTLREITGGWDDPIAALELHVALRLDAITAAH